MNETTIMLSPSPGNPRAKLDFLATVEPLATPRQPPPPTLPFELVLNGYTREPWSSGKAGHQNCVDQRRHDGDGDCDWQCCYLVSTDGRNRLPGFVRYLRDRKKAALAKFEATEELSSAGPGGKAILVVPFDAPPIRAEELPKGVDESQVIFVKYLRDESTLKKGGNNSQQQQQQQRQQQKMQQQRQMHQQITQQKKSQQSKHTVGSLPKPTSGKGGGFLGNLLGAQRRTENHLDTVRSSKASNDVAFDPNTGAAGCINAFRKKISADLEKFKSDSSEFTHRISISLAGLVTAVPADERDRVTMDVFKFTVYEQVEEVGMDRWVAAKEPSEFMDECIIAVYKEGHCPAEVLEDLNKGELPDEIKGQAKHIAEAKSKAIQRKGKKHDERMMKESMAGDGNNDVVVLNTNKRDRRTLEQIQRDMQCESEDTKRSRFE